MAGERGFGNLMAWAGAATALISFGTAVYKLLHAQGELRERQRVVAEQQGIDVVNLDQINRLRKAAKLNMKRRR